MRKKVAVVILLVDLLDVPGSFLNGIRDLVGKNPVMLVGTKLDLLPKGTKPGAMIEFLNNLVEARGISIVSSHLVSSKTGQGREGNLFKTNTDFLLSWSNTSF